eukprot:CAMPEP_0173376438 /NCGR_PEP_ID=MMETSP1144-20121109/30171_1 /TAXON_ID=483371 /ORGANISM="non described non described, Strain CCMP2298" /LENGTH=85 /DNA_ID=CAMNT_0014328959 /DNA_START=364 /DNA_END=621 /DNA_ORIENTATION=+
MWVHLDAVVVHAHPHHWDGHLAAHLDPLLHDGVEVALAVWGRIPPAVVVQPVLPEGEVDVVQQLVIMRHLVAQHAVDVSLMQVVV